MVLGFTAAAIAMLVSLIPAGLVIARGDLADGGRRRMSSSPRSW